MRFKLVETFAAGAGEGAASSSSSSSASLSELDELDEGDEERAFLGASAISTSESSLSLSEDELSESLELEESDDSLSLSEDPLDEFWEASKISSKDGALLISAFAFPFFFNSFSNEALVAENPCWDKKAEIAAKNCGDTVFESLDSV